MPVNSAPPPGLLSRENGGLPTCAGAQSRWTWSRGRARQDRHPDVVRGTPRSLRPLGLRPQADVSPQSPRFLTCNSFPPGMSSKLREVMVRGAGAASGRAPGEIRVTRHCCCYFYQHKSTLPAPTTPLWPQEGTEAPPFPPRCLPLGVPTGACKKEGREVRGAGAPIPLTKAPTCGRSSVGRAWRRTWRPHRRCCLLKASATPALACDSQVTSLPYSEASHGSLVLPKQSQNLLDDPRALCPQTPAYRPLLPPPNPQLWPASLSLDHIPAPGPLCVMSPAMWISVWLAPHVAPRPQSKGSPTSCRCPLRYCLCLLQDVGIVRTGTTQSVLSEPQ